jgi:hypothetical protein
MKKQPYKLERIVRFFPAFDKRNPDPSKNCGIGAVRCIMVLKGNDRAVHFVFSTGMYLPETMQEYAKDGRLTPTKSSFSERYYIMNSPMGYDVGYHDIKRHFKGQHVSKDNCDWIGRPCYGDGSALQSDRFMDMLLRQGDEAIWTALEEEYKQLRKRS